MYEWLQERGAVETWAAAQIEAGYPAKNRVLDGRFVRPRTQCRLAWTLTANAHVEATVGDGLTTDQRPYFRIYDAFAPPAAGLRLRCFGGNPRNSTIIFRERSGYVR